MKALILAVLLLFSTSYAQKPIIFDSFEKEVGVEQSPNFMFVYGLDLQLDLGPLLAGDTIFAYALDGTLCGAKILESPAIGLNNILRFMPVYFNQGFGLQSGDTVKFKISSSSGIREAAVSFPIVVGTQFGDRHRIYNFHRVENCCNTFYGDWNQDGIVDIVDISLLIEYIWLGGKSPECLALGDINNSGEIDIVDVSVAVEYLWEGIGELISCEE